MTPTQERSLLRLATMRLRALRQENQVLRVQLKLLQLRLQMQVRRRA